MIPQLASRSKCTGCGACVASCKQEAIIMQHDKNGHLNPNIKKSECTGCRLCEKSCPVLQPDKLTFNDASQIESYSAYSKINEVSKHSASGGIFTQLALEFISLENSYVSGAILLKENKVHHIIGNSQKDIFLMSGSKYLQSDASTVYNDIKRYLKANARVLFSGTPCQIAGLFTFLGNTINTSNLFTIELICHGVPSRISADLCSKYYKTKYIISFRDKENGWCNNMRGTCYHCTYALDNNNFVRRRKGEDVFYDCFGITHRSSCYKCYYSQINRLSDLTLGDQWGRYKEFPEQAMSGVNLVLCNTSKGKYLLSSSTNIEVVPMDNKYLNAPPLFTPALYMNKVCFSNIMYLLRRLPTSWAITILTGQWKKNPIILPYKVWYKINWLRNERLYKKKILAIHQKYHWL